MMFLYIRYLLFFFALFSSIASAREFDLILSFAQGSNQPVLVKAISSFCMHKYPDEIRLSNGKASFAVDTQSSIFDPCGYEHSSLSFSAINASGKEVLAFEFYKPLSEMPHMKVDTPGESSRCSAGSVNLICNAL